MKTYRYRGISSGGAAVEGIVEAINATEASNKARENCRFVTDIEPVGGGTMDKIMNFDIGAALSGGKVKPKKLSLVCSQLGIELKAGLALVRALDLCSANEQDKKMKQVLYDVARNVEDGNSLAESFKAHEGYLPKTFVETIRAGESSGKLDECFEKLKVYYENSAAVGSKVKSALVYPIMLLVVAVVVIVIIMLKAVPVFETAFADLGNDLPGVTKALIGMSHLFKDYILLVIAVVAAIVIGLSVFGKTDKGKHTYAWIALKFPGIGLVNRMNACTQFASTMETMLSAGLSLVEATSITAAVIDNILVQEDMQKAVDGVTEGKTLGEGIKKCQWLPTLLAEMTAVGEETGNMKDTLSVVNDYYTKEVSAAVTTALGIMEPCIVVVMALMVVFILLSVYLPLFSMYGTV